MAQIGMFDSGNGGWTTLEAVRQMLPGVEIEYIADLKNAPYGTKEPGDLLRATTRVTERLVANGAKIVVVACNTATAAAIGRLRETFPSTPFVGLEPAVKPACLRTRSGVVGVVATERSLAGRKFLATVARYGVGKRIMTAVGRGWVEAVEAGAEAAPETEERVREVLDPIIAAGADIIVLGCTHYPFLRPVIEKVVGGRGIEVIDSGAAVEKRVESLLDEYGLRAPEGHAAAYRFLSMAGREYCERLCRKALSGDGCAREK